MRKISLFPICIFALLCIQLVAVSGQNHIPVSILSSGGNVSSSSKFLLQSTLGQFVIGTSQSQSSSSKAGFWYVSDKKIPASIEEIDNGHAMEFEVSQNYPNPFTVRTEFNISLSKPAMVTASVYSTQGLKVGEIVNNYLDAGKYSFDYIPYNLPNGLYYYRLGIEGNVFVGKMVLFR